MNPSVITLVERQGLYYLADELKLRCPTFFAGTSKTIRKIIEKKKIPETEYVYATTFKKQWKLCDSSCKKGKLLLTKNWSELNINLNETTSNVSLNEDVSKNENENKNINEPIINAPGLLILEDNKKFRDNEGNMFEIEIRGEKQKDKIFFKVKDVSVAFNLPNLNSVLLHTDKGYERNTDYITFNRTLTIDGRDIKKPTIYLTYKGLLRVLFVSRNKNVEKFQDWAEEKLFTIQFGNKDEKEELASELLNVNIRCIRDVFKSSVNTFPCVYLLELGKVSNLRESLGISDEIDDKMTVYKYGMTEDMKERMLKHINDYGKIKNVVINLKLFSYIDVKYKVNAEQDLRLFFNSINFKLEVDGRNELIVLQDNMYKIVENHFKTVSNEYLGATREIQKEIETLKNNYEKDMLKNSTEMLKKDLEIQKLQNEKDNYKNMYNYSVKEQENKETIYKLQIENLKLQIELGKK
jgi:hypothetical protein